MNERLKEIEKQATRRIETKVRKGGWDNDREPYEYKTVVDTFFDKEKFAELIVKECMEVILAKASEYPETDEWYDWTNGMDQAQAEICVHFGVE